MLVGRDREIELLHRAIGPGRRVAVCGPPGIGKTALVRAALRGARILEVDLTRAETPNDLWAALGRSAGAPVDAPDRGSARMARILREVAVVLLDSADHLGDPAWASLAPLQTERPDLAWVVTAVAHPGSADATLTLGPLPAEAARELLLTRARDAALGSPVDPDDPAWQVLAERLEGLPLALELAAARLGWMRPGELVDRLDVAVVRGDDRRTSVEGALRYAWSLLGPPEREALVRLSLARGFTLEVAEGLLGADALATLERLRARSAVTAREGRLWVLEGLRRIAADQADDALKAEWVSYWAGRAATLRARSRGPEAVEAFRALRDEQDTFRAALDLARALGRAEEAARLALTGVLAVRTFGPLARIDELPDPDGVARAAVGAGAAEAGAELLAHWGGALVLLGRGRQARQALQAAIAASTGPAPSSTAWAELGWLEVLEGHLDAAGAAFERALVLAPDGAAAALALIRAAVVADLRRDRAGAVRALEEALARVDRDAAPRIRGTLRLNLGVFRAAAGRLVEAEDLLRGAADELADLDRTGRGTALLNLALLRLVTGEVDEAEVCAQEGHDLQDVFGSEHSRGLGAMVRGLVRWAAGDRVGAREWLVRAADRLQGLDPMGLATVRAFRAALEADAGRGGSLAVELEAARADGAEPALIDVLAAVGGEPPPPGVDEALDVRAARALLHRGPPALRLDRGGRWFERPGGRVDLARRGALRRILGALVDARVARPGVGLTVQQLFDAGWPGERAVPDAAAARVYSAVRELRALGMGAVLVREADGYRLDPGTRIEVDGA